MSYTGALSLRAFYLGGVRTGYHSEEMILAAVHICEGSPYLPGYRVGRINKGWEGYRIWKKRAWEA